MFSHQFEGKLVEKINFGKYALKANGSGYLSNRQIEAARRALTRYMKRRGKVWIMIFPDKVFTKIPAETRMGKGKGSPEIWTAKVKNGKILFEISGVDEDTAREALRLASYKLSIKTKFITNEMVYE